MSTANLTAAALITQFLYLVILWIGILLLPASERSLRNEATICGPS